MTVMQCSGCRHARPGGVVLPGPCATCTMSTDGTPSNYSPAEWTATSQAPEKISAKVLDADGGTMIQYAPDMEKTFYIGIDPGKDGALAVLTPQGNAYAMAFDEEGYRDRLSGFYVSYAKPEDRPRTFCVVEHVNAMPGQGVTSCFSFGQNFGFILGLLAAYRVPYELVRPQKWKRAFSCTSDKNTSVEVAQRLFPQVDLRRTPKCAKPHDGKAEALLMAEYARRLRQ